MFFLSWQKTVHDIPSIWKPWLLESGSFMKKLNQRGQFHSTISVLKQAWQKPTQDEKKCLDLKQNWAWIREVRIQQQTQQWMFARTVFPRQTLTGSGKQFTQLKNRALGSLLFNSPHIKRSAFEFAKVYPNTPLHRYLSALTERTLEVLWARRSIFWIEKKSILLTEIFFPDLLTKLSL